MTIASRRAGLARVILILVTLIQSAAAMPTPDHTTTVKELVEAQRNERDVVAQESMAWWTGVMGLTSVLGTLLSAGAAGAALLSVHLSRQALRQAEDSVAETVKTGKAQSRAYVYAKEAAYSSEAPDIILVVINTGQTPATYFRAGGDVKIVNRGEVGPSIAIQDYEMKEWPALGAGQSLKVQVGTSETRKIVNAFKEDGTVDEKRLLVQGKIVYGDVFGHEVETPFVFYVQRNQQHFRRPVAALEGFKVISKD
ncbi:hypothetical protein GOC57_11655 [Sinorhizobium meliloti]|nr:hypothetical protein [Sinorhizobium meliloti]MDW9859450.1 hypothetical protein [Sinorhizobium meliloti]MDW9964571.1 hypothetical protein [Sinorhizobium meliloti]MDX0336831.1 hypothetical protein [Sinorhizobium meliloti]